MQRLFSMFPRGRAGLALLVLRLALGIAIAVSAGIASPWMAVAYGVCGLALCLGLLTPFAAGSYLVLSLLAWRLTGAVFAAMQVCMMVNAAVIALLGPGGYSLDARLFGRHRVLVGEREPLI